MQLWAHDARIFFSYQDDPIKFTDKPSILATIPKISTSLCDVTSLSILITNEAFAFWVKPFIDFAKEFISTSPLFKSIFTAETRKNNIFSETLFLAAVVATPNSISENFEKVDVNMRNNKRRKIISINEVKANRFFTL